MCPLSFIKNRFFVFTGRMTVPFHMRKYKRSGHTRDHPIRIKLRIMSTRKRPMPPSNGGKEVTTGCCSGIMKRTEKYLSETRSSI